MQSTRPLAPSAIAPPRAAWLMPLLGAALVFFVVALPPAPASADSSDWLFDHSYYTNRPKSGQRTWQYAPAPTPFRDPYAVLDSSTSSYPFEPDGYGAYPWPYYYNPAYSPMMYPGTPWGQGWFYGWNVNDYLPYDGQPMNTD
jgi:hypothetical protein